MERKTKPVMGKLRLPFFKRWKGQRAGSSASTDISADAFFLFDKNLDIIGMNPLARSLFHLILGENLIGGDVLNGAPNVKPDNENNGRYGKYLNAIRKGKPFFADSIVIHSGFLDINLKAEAFKVGKGFGIIFSDLDALKKSAETQYESQGASTTELKSAPDCIFIFDLKGAILHGSRGGEKLTGYPWEEIRGKSFSELPLFAPEYLPKAARLLELSAAGEPTGPEEFELIRKDGSRVSVEISTCPIGRGEEIEIVGIAHDITERKKSEEALSRSEDKYRAIVETSLDGIYRVDTSGKFVFTNEAFANIFGYRREELSGKHFSSLLSVETFPKVKEMGEEVLSGKNVREEIPVKHKDGHEVLVNFSAAPLKVQGKIIGLTGVLRDITERKKVEEALWESEQKYRDLFNSAEVALFRSRIADGKILECNDLLAKLFGYDSREQCMAEHVTSEHYVDHGVRAQIMTPMLENGKVENFEAQVTRRDGSPFWVSYSAHIYPERGFIEGAIVDITKRKKAEEALRQSEERFRNVLDNSLDMVYRLNLQTGTYDYVSPSTEKILGYSPEEFVAFTIERGRSLAHPDDLARLDENIIGLVTSKAGTASSIDYRIKHKEVGYRWVSDSRSVVYDDGNNPVAVVGSLRDITERKKAEEELWSARERLQRMFDSVDDGIAVTDLEGFITDVNPKGLELYRVSTKEEIIVKSAFELIIPEEREMAMAEMQRTLGRGTTGLIEHNVVRSDGSKFLAEMNVSLLRDISGKPTGFVAVLRDITERKQAEEVLRESEEKYRLLAENVTDVIWTMDMDLRFTYISPSVTCLRGLTVKEAMAERLEDIFSPSSFQALVKTFEKGIVAEATGLKDPSRSWTLELEEYCKDGSLIWVDIRAGLLRDRDGRPVGLVGVTRDITKRKKLEEAVRESESKFRGVLEHSVDVIYQLNLKTGTYDYVSPSSVEALGYSPEELIALGFEKATSVIHPDDVEMVREHFNKLTKRTAADDTAPPTIEYRIIHRKSGCRWMSDTSSVLYDDNNGPIAITGNVHNITERKKAEEDLRDNEVRFRELFESMSSGVAVYEAANKGQDFIFKDFNKAGERIEKVKRGDLIGESVLDGFPGVKALGLLDVFRRVWRTGNPEHHPISLYKDERIVGYRENYVYRLPTGEIVAIYDDATERKKAEEALKESEERYRALVVTAGLAGEGIMIVERAEGNKAVIAFVNDTLSGMLGYQLGEMPGMPARDLFLPGDRIWLQEKNRKRRKGEALPSHYGVMALRKDGSMLPIEISMGAMRYQGKNATVVYVRDVTERKKAEESLRESEAQFRAIFDGAAIGVGLLDSDGRPFKINPALQQMLGYTLDELRSRAFTEYLQPDDAKSELKLFRETVAGKRDHYQVEKRLIRKDGQMIWGRVTLSAVRGLGGKLQFAIGMIEDITDSKLATENLRKSEEHFRSLIENASEVVLIIDRDGIITYASPAVERVLGYTIEEGIGTMGSSYIHPDDMPEVMKVFNELMQNPGTAVSMELRVRHKDGSWRVAEAVGRNLLGDHSVAGLVVNFRDVTEREQAHEELLQHTKQVEALHAIAQAVSQTLELEELLDTSLDKVIEVMGAEAGCVYLLDTVENELVLRTGRGLSDEAISKLATIKLNENNVQKILEWKGGSTPLRKIFGGNRSQYTKEAKEKEQIQSFAVAPFAVRGQLSGLIAVGNRSHREFSSGDMDLLRAVGIQIGIGTQNAMLYEEVRALIRETIDAQERERERVCLEVHDGVAQTLVAAFQYLQALEATAPDDAQTKKLLAKASAQVKQAIQESREVINSLQPATLSDLGLVSTLRHELKRLGQETGLKIDFKADAIRFPRDVEVGLYRIIREAVFNARKHANTKQLRVKINSEDGGVRVEVRDWGKGFDQAYLDRARRRGTGLFSIRKRAELLKGTCEIQSKPGEGTTVCVDIPFVDAK